MDGISPKGIIASTFCMLIALQSPGAAAAEPPFQEAQRLLATGDGQGAVALLLPYLDAQAGEPGYDFLLGQAYRKDGQSGQARFALERVLMVDPGHLQARLILAEILAEGGDEGRAEHLLADLSPAALTPDMRERVERIRAKTPVQEETSQSWGYLRAGLGFNDNLTSGPDVHSLLIPSQQNPPPPPGGPPPPPVYTELDELRQDADFFHLLEGGAGLRHPLDGKTHFLGGLDVGQKRYLSRHDSDEVYASAYLGVDYRQDANLFTLTGLGQTYLLDDTRYRDALGGYFDWQRQLSDQQWLDGYVQVLRYAYNDASEENTWKTVVGATHRIGYGVIHPDLSLYFGGYAGAEREVDHDMDYLGNGLWGGRVGGTHRFSEKTTLWSEISFENRHHDDADTLYFTKRHDQEFNFDFAVEQAINDDWQLMPTFSYLRNQSNIELYDYP